MPARGPMFEYTLLATDPSCHARFGTFNTPHGAFDLPAFMPVGTRGTVRGVTPAQLRECGAQIVLANTYHLALRPGADVVAALGGLHELMGWEGPILTDSGGFQVFSLAALREVDESGVTFRSHIDGRPLRLDPESAIRIQNDLGADIIMCFDQCPHLPASREEIEAAVDRTIRWAAACKAAHRRGDQALFGIVQGGLELEIRRRCLAALRELDFAGYAVGGLSVGESPDAMIELLGAFAPGLPADRPRYLMGVGRPIDVVRAVMCGMDMFDCVLPTRNGRNSSAFTDRGTVKLRNESHKRSTRPLQEDCDCYACGHFSRGYLRHLFLSGEMLGPILVSLHNLTYYQRLMQRIRAAIRDGRLAELAAQVEAASTRSDDEESQ